ncbi:hypothetical protein PV326_001948, partial [Microctonus aethiopoides]
MGTWFKSRENNGSFIIRYRLYETCSNLQIIVKLKDTNVKPVSISTKGLVYEEECYCPNPSVDVWLDDYTCAQNYSQILEDLKYFPKINFDEIRNEIIKEYNKPHSFSICHYVIKNNREMLWSTCWLQNLLRFNSIIANKKSCSAGFGIFYEFG